MKVTLKYINRMRDTQEYYHFQCQLDTEGIIGHNWAECH